MAGFIRMQGAQRLLVAAHEALGQENLNTYHDVHLMHYRLDISQKIKSLTSQS